MNALLVFFRRAILAVLMLVFSGPFVSAGPQELETGPSSAKSDRLKVVSDLLAVYPDKNYTEFTGHVEAMYQGRVLKCARLKAFFSKEAKQLDRIEAEEDVLLIDREIEARCDRAIYYKQKDLIILRGNPRLKSGDNLFRGEIISVNLLTRRMTIEGAVEADITPDQGKSKNK